MTVEIKVARNNIRTSKIVEYYAKQVRVKDLYIAFPSKNEISFIYRGSGNKEEAIKEWKKLFEQQMELEAHEVRYKGDKAIIKEVVII